ncbi:5-methylcytosine-specific restriction endonuclease system specificity protein McrC [Paenalkalicoccus suaedae]|uniref:5-methylcytosine-specific restriction endonuclease system specificity protein McrC n=1 Tax=Paenalkalicoccus suaedae TaxID=2592382 RepID=A0A859FJS5_9BACI|nr:5-methylcytosine-specific restriction endonuclease system specificity protein McrC [Paenalkalicoccus suaedae]QKS73061.1 5-methylcytosine-specific restriction endonuclease system specificity protein McrC [Paenalkalicoccus suaedae]
MIKLQNIYYMMAYAFRLLDSKGQAKVDPDKFDGALDLYAAILHMEVSNQVKKGLAKGYVELTDTLRSPRGKMHVSQSIKQNTIVSKQIVCTVDDYIEDTEVNRILKATMRQLVRSQDVKKDQVRKLKKLLFYFDYVGECSLKSVKWRSLHVHRHLSSYRPLMQLCELIVDSLLLSEDEGVKTAPHIVDDQALHRLYEKFVLAYYKRHYPDFRPRASAIGWDVAGEDTAFLPSMQTDIVLHHKGRRLIIDTKYYTRTMQTNSLYNSRSLHSSNMYQMYTYVMNMGCGKPGAVEGMLLYAKTDEAITPNQSHEISGYRISAKTLDLDTDFEEIRSQLDEIAEGFMERVV